MTLQFCKSLHASMNNQNAKDRFQGERLGLHESSGNEGGEEAAPRLLRRRAQPRLQRRPRERRHLDGSELPAPNKGSRGSSFAHCAPSQVLPAQETTQDGGLGATLTVQEIIRSTGGDFAPGPRPHPALGLRHLQLDLRLLYGHYVAHGVASSSGEPRAN